MIADFPRSRTILAAALLVTGLCACCTPGPMTADFQPEGEAAPAGLPGEAIDPAFEHLEMPDDGNQDPGAGIPGIDP
jgi:hypothetical protein